MVNNRKLKGHTLVSELFQPATSGFAPKDTKSTQKRKSPYKDYIPNRGQYTDLSNFTTRKLLDLSYKGASPRSNTEIQSLLLPKGSNPDTFREEKTYCKKICMIRNIANPLLAPALLRDKFCNKNNAISPETIEGGNH